MCSTCSIEPWARCPAQNVLCMTTAVMILLGGVPIIHLPPHVALARSPQTCPPPAAPPVLSRASARKAGASPCPHVEASVVRLLRIFSLFSV